MADSASSSTLPVDRELVDSVAFHGNDPARAPGDGSTVLGLQLAAGGYGLGHLDAMCFQKTGRSGAGGAATATQVEPVNLPHGMVSVGDVLDSS
ncbi:MAG: hypothetical protein U5O39_02060 [Gammaproteobacteria bacterium]|nr:hypothetical protein [Gammaproteobacteria bacterium]